MRHLIPVALFGEQPVIGINGHGGGAGLGTASVSIGVSSGIACSDNDRSVSIGDAVSKHTDKGLQSVQILASPSDDQTGQFAFDTQTDISPARQHADPGRDVGQME